MVSVRAVVAILVGCCALINGESGPTAAPWGYSGKYEPSTWKIKYPACGGVRQSPINVNTLNVERSKTSSKITWKNYEVMPDSLILSNNGHSLKLDPTHKRNAPHLTIGSSTYNLDHIHFHWGVKNNEGSEHTFNSKRYPLEMHAVHLKVVNGTVVNPAVIVVATTLFQISPVRHAGLGRFLKYTPDVKYAHTETEVRSFKINELLPKFTGKYFHYEGSLTTPPCAEVVTFLINAKLAKVTEKQMNRFRVLLNEEKKPLGGNFRPVQPLNGRKIKFVLY